MSKDVVFFFVYAYIIFIQSYFHPYLSAHQKGTQLGLLWLLLVDRFTLGPSSVSVRGAKAVQYFIIQSDSLTFASGDLCFGNLENRLFII